MWKSLNAVMLNSLSLPDLGYQLLVKYTFRSSSPNVSRVGSLRPWRQCLVSVSYLMVCASNPSKKKEKKKGSSWQEETRFKHPHITRCSWLRQHLSLSWTGSILPTLIYFGWLAEVLGTLLAALLVLAESSTKSWKWSEYKVARCWHNKLWNKWNAVTEEMIVLGMRWCLKGHI